MREGDYNDDVMLCYVGLCCAVLLASESLSVNGTLPTLIMEVLFGGAWWRCFFCICFVSASFDIRGRTK